MINAKITRKQKHNAIKGLSEGSAEAVAKTTIALQSQVKALAPVDFGALRNSINRVVKGLKGTVFTNLVYAMIQEFGGIIKPLASKYLRFKTKSGNWVTTSKVTIKAANGGKGYFRPSVVVIKKKIKNIFAKELRASIRKN